MNNNTEKKHQMSNRVLDAIEKRGIEPKAKWHFLVRESFIWITAGVAFFVGSIATALSIYIINASRFIEHQIAFSDIGYIFRLIPFVWILLLVVGIFYTVYAIRETRRGYKWSSSWIVGVALVSSIVLGSSAFASGVGETVDAYLLTTVPIYKPLTNFKPQLFMNENEGVVAGMIVAFGESSFSLLRIDSDELITILFDDKTNIYFSNRALKIHIPVRVVLEDVEKEDVDEKFYAKEIAPFRGRGGKVKGMMMNKEHRPQEQRMQIQKEILQGEINNL